MGADQKATYSNNSYNSFNFSENYEIDLNNYTWQIMYNSPLDDIHQVLKKIGDKPIRQYTKTVIQNLKELFDKFKGLNCFVE